MSQKAEEIPDWGPDNASMVKQTSGNSPPPTHTHNFRFFGLVRTSLYDFTWPQGKLVIYFIAKRFNWKQNQSATKEQGRFVAGRQRM